MQTIRIKLEHRLRLSQGTKDLPLILRADGTAFSNGILMDHMECMWTWGHTGGGLTMGTGLSYYYFDDTEDQYEEFHGDWNWWRWWLDASSVMDQVVLEAQRLWSRGILSTKTTSLPSFWRRMVRRNGKRTSTLTCVISSFTDISRKICPSVVPHRGHDSDFHKEALQGALFLRFRDLIMGVTAQPPPRLSKPKKKIASKRRLVRRTVAWLKESHLTAGGVLDSNRNPNPLKIHGMDEYTELTVCQSTVRLKDRIYCACSIMQWISSKGFDWRENKQEVLLVEVVMVWAHRGAHFYWII
jgi:hypothetical protein